MKTGMAKQNICLDWQNILTKTLNKISDLRPILNEINVFPVADGDTGNNIVLTLKYALDNADKSKSLNILFKTFAEGCLQNSRGNSGLILSRFFTGFSKAIANHQNNQELYNALFSGYHEAYDVLDQPRQGTILSIMKVSSDKTHLKSNNYYKAIYESSLSELINSRSELKVLIESGTIDSGALAFFQFIESIYECFSHEDKKDIELYIAANKKIIKNYFPDQSLDYKKWKDKQLSRDEKFTSNDLEYRYCTEFFIYNSNLTVDKALSLKDYGDSFAYAKSDDFMKIHIHSSDVESVVNFSSGLGKVKELKVDDMMYQHNHIFENTDFEPDIDGSAFIAVLPDRKLTEIVQSIGDSISSVYLLNGSKFNYELMFSSLSAVKKKNIIVCTLKNFNTIKNNVDFPFEDILDMSEKNIELVYCNSLSEIIFSAFHFQQELSVEENLNSLHSEIKQLQSLDILKVIKEKNHSFLAEYGDSILKQSTELKGLFEFAIESLNPTTGSFLSIYYSKDLSCEINNYKEYLEQGFSGVDTDWISLGDNSGKKQNHKSYQFIFSLE